MIIQLRPFRVILGRTIADYVTREELDTRLRLERVRVNHERSVKSAETARRNRKKAKRDKMQKLAEEYLCAR